MCPLLMLGPGNLKSIMQLVEIWKVKRIFKKSFQIHTLNCRQPSFKHIRMLIKKIYMYIRTDYILKVGRYAFV
jgi:hypothetical protein